METKKDSKAGFSIENFWLLDMQNMFLEWIIDHMQNCGKNK